MRLASTAFTDGRAIPRRHTCDGDNVSPPLRWDDAPPGTRGFALLCDDPDAPGGVWRHWAVYDIPATQTQLTVALPAHAGGLKQAANDFRARGYGGPCPPRGHGAHHYRFTLLALDTDTLGLVDGARYADVEHAARAHTLAQARLTGTYQR